MDLPEHANAGVEERLASVRARIAAACAAHGRALGDVQLVAVSKRHSADAIRRAYEAGQRVFGESYVQELEEKRAALSDLPELEFRFIGRVQRNKAKRVVRAAASVDSVDSLKLAIALERHAAELGRPVPVLLQLNLAGEATKGGLASDELAEAVRYCRDASHLVLDGLMTLPPKAPEEAAKAFRALRLHKERLGLPTLSMGMSSDLELAIAEGSTQVRVGTAIFGPRS